MSNLRSATPFRPGAVTQFRAPKRTRFELVCEALESRQLLSTTATSTPNLSQIMAQQNLQVIPLDLRDHMCRTGCDCRCLYHRLRRNRTCC